MGENKSKIFDLDLKKKTIYQWPGELPVVRHSVVEGMGIEHGDLEHDKLVGLLELFCENLGLHIVGRLHHQFVPHGKSIVFILEESHIGVHSWPERGYVHMDLVTCTKKDMSGLKIVREFKKIFTATHVRILKMRY